MLLFSSSFNNFFAFSLDGWKTFYDPKSFRMDGIVHVRGKNKIVTKGSSMLFSERNFTGLT